MYVYQMVSKFKSSLVLFGRRCPVLFAKCCQAATVRVDFARELFEGPVRILGPSWALLGPFVWDLLDPLIWELLGPFISVLRPGPFWPILGHSRWPCWAHSFGPWARAMYSINKCIKLLLNVCDMYSTLLMRFNFSSWYSMYSICIQLT